MVFQEVSRENGQLPARHTVRAWVLALCALLICILLGSCGGGTQVAGVGSSGSGVAEGSITGFGSVLVDGVEYDDSALDPGLLAGLRLGQRVRLTFGGNNLAQSLSLLVQLRGPVDQALDADGWMRVTGQWVRVVQSADDASRGGVTALGGFSSASQIGAGQDVAVYGSWARDESKGGYVLVASRIEKVDTPGDTVLTGGVVRALDGNQLTLNADSNGTQVAANALPQLAVGQVVSVQVPRAALGGGRVQAQAVQNTSLGALDLTPYATVRVGGLATDYDASGFSVTVQGTRLKLSGVPPAADAIALMDQQFVRLEGYGPPPSQQLVGTAMPTGGANEIKGQIAGVDWSAPVVSFTLRNVPISAPAAVIATACRTAAAGSTLNVDVQGMAPAPGAAVVATRVSCALAS